eukprot:scaffold55642_cov14-Tisochrysis_lutea.AAC.2
MVHITKKTHMTGKAVQCVKNTSVRQRPVGLPGEFGAWILKSHSSLPDNLNKHSAHSLLLVYLAALASSEV